MVELRVNLEEIPAYFDKLKQRSAKQPVKMSKEDIASAFNAEKHIKEVIRNIDYTVMQLAHSLFEFKSKAWYRILGYNSFNQWVNSLDTELDPSSAYRYVKVYEHLIASGAFVEEELERKGISKLEIAIPLVDPSSEGWKERKSQVLRLLDLTRGELTKKVADYQSKQKVEIEQKPHVDEKVKFSAETEEDRILDEVFAIRKEQQEAAKKPPKIEKASVLGIAGMYELIPLDDELPVGAKLRAGVQVLSSKVYMGNNRVFLEFGD